MKFSPPEADQGIGARYTEAVTEVLHANIFFVITSIAVVLFTLLLCIALYHVIKIIRSIRRIVERVEEGSEVIAEDMEQLRSFVLEGSLVSQVISFFMASRPMATRRRRSTRTKHNEVND